jgi:hypothetical protein
MAVRVAPAMRAIVLLNKSDFQTLPFQLELHASIADPTSQQRFEATAVIWSHREEI